MGDLRSCKMTNVLMLARVLDTGGIERDISKFARHLPNRGFQPHVACFNPGGMRWKEIEAAGLPTLHLPVTSFRSWSAIRAVATLRKYIQKNDVCLIHAFDVSADLFAAPLGRLWGIPVLSSQLCYRDLLDPTTGVIMRVIDRIAAGTFVNCEGISKHLQTDYNVPPERIHICYNGFEPDEFHSNGRTRPSVLANASVVVGTVALLRPEKNLALLVDAFEQILQIDQQARLLIVGSGPGLAALEEQATALQIRHACIFQPAVERPAEWMRAIDIFVLPSKSEGFSNSLLEAMACGCCPVASRVGGTPELIEEHERGLLFESGNARELADVLLALVNKPEARVSMASNAAHFARNYLSMDHAVSRLAGIYNKLLGKPASQGGEEFVSLSKRDRSTRADTIAALKS